MLKYVFDFSKDNTKDIMIAANNDCKNVVLSNFFFIPVGYYFLISEWGRKKHEAWRPVYIAEKGSPISSLSQPVLQHYKI